MEEIDQRAALSKTDIDEKVPYLEITYSVENKDSKELQFFRMENVTLMMILHMMCLLKISSIPGIHLWGQKSKPVRLPTRRNKKWHNWPFG